MLVNQELYCHSCNQYVRFEIDIDQDGDYTIPCPNCGHEHYRRIKDRRITSRRWASSSTIIVDWAYTSSVTMSNDSGRYYFYSYSSSV